MPGLSLSLFLFASQAVSAMRYPSRFTCCADDERGGSSIGSPRGAVSSRKASETLRGCTALNWSAETTTTGSRAPMTCGSPARALRIGAIAFLVRDYDEALAYYIGELGFTLIEDTLLGAGKR